MSRKPLYHYINLILPTAAIAMLGLMAFWLPPDSGEKVSLSVTILLATAVFQLVVNENMPVQSNSVPIICKYTF